MLPRAAEVVFLSLSLRLYTLRTLIISSLLLISVNIEGTLNWPVIPGTLGPGFWVALYTLIAVQQILGTLKWPMLYGALDLFFLIVEVIGVGHYAKIVPLQSWMPETIVFHAFLAWMVVVTISLTICIRIAEAIYSNGQSLTRPFDILAYESNFSRSNSTLKKGWMSTFHMLFGRSIWKKNFVGETMFLRTIRGILAIIVLMAVFSYTVFNVVLSPIKEAALSPVKAYRISGITPTDLLDNTRIPAWRVTYALALQEAVANGTNLTSLIPSDMFFSAVSVTTIWPGADNTDKDNLPMCHKAVETNIFHNQSFYYYWCPSLGDNLSLPNLNINVDFGPLATALSRIVPSSARMQLPLIIGLSNDTIFDYTHTVPITFIPGVNMAASYIWSLRQIYTNGILAALGIFEPTITFFMPHIVAIYPDPTATFVGANLSSLNLFYQDNYGEITFIQDYREKSVISGFSVVGGLWTAFSGIFAMLFGASMLHIFHGSKPLSIYGVAHRFQTEAMKKDCLEKYPQILKENCSPENRGLLSLLRDHLINLDFVEDEKGNLESSEVQEKQADMESTQIPFAVAQGHPQKYFSIPWSDDVDK